MDLKLLLVLTKIVYILSMSEFIAFDDFLEKIPQNCVCVPYWQCKEDYTGLVADGIDLMDIRITRNINVGTLCTGDFDVCCRVECGRKNNGLISNGNEENNTLEMRILGENNMADFGEFPWMLAVLQDKIFLCGGSLIHPQVAVTAAHCVTHSENYKVRAGEWNWETRNEPLPYQEHMTQKVVIHPHFHSASLRNDIALLILEKPFQLAANVGIVCIPHQGATMVKDKCIASGWGKNSINKGSYQSTLKKISLPIVTHDVCLQTLRDAKLGPSFGLHRSFICAGGEKKKDTCKGDGGSPLICPISEQPDKYEQFGIVSWGLTCGVQNTPGVYVNVALFSDWIDKEMIYHNFDTTIYRSDI